MLLEKQLGVFINGRIEEEREVSGGFDNLFVCLC